VQLGNRRFVVVAALGALALCALTGCSTLTSSDATAVAIGQQALGFKSTDSSPSGKFGWTSSVPCPAALKTALTAGLPKGSTVSLLDPLNVSGPLLDPNLTADDVATCAFSLTTGGRSITQLYFVGMDQTAASVITSKLTSDGFAAGIPTTVGTGLQQVYTSGAGSIAVSRLTENGQSVVIVSG
jgi:hypothetical protein